MGRCKGAGLLLNMFAKADGTPQSARVEGDAPPQASLQHARESFHLVPKKNGRRRSRAAGAMPYL